MPRSYTALSLIQLPRLSGREAVVLVTQLETAAAGAKQDFNLASLPPSLTRSSERMKAASALLAAILSPQAESDTQAKRKADRLVDNGWAALHAWLDGWCLLPESKNPHLAQTLALRDLVFSTGLEFTLLPYRIEWQESMSRLDAIARDGHTTTLQALGGAVFLANLHEAQASYGDVLHITKPLPAPTDEVMRTNLLATLDTIRDYVNRASAHADPAEPGSEALAEALLRPVVAWQSRPTGNATPGDADDEAKPPPPAAPPVPSDVVAPK